MQMVESGSVMVVTVVKVVENCSVMVVNVGIQKLWQAWKWLRMK